MPLVHFNVVPSISFLTLHSQQLAHHFSSLVFVCLWMREINQPVSEKDSICCGQTLELWHV